MTAIDPDTHDAAARRARRFTRINNADAWFQMLGLAWVTPMLKAAAGDNPRAQMAEIWRLLGIPLLAISIFIGAWAALAPTVQTSLGAIPGPVQVWEQAVNLNADAVREREKEVAFFERQDARNAELIANAQAEDVRDRSYTGKPTYYPQIWTSIKTALGVSSIDKDLISVSKVLKMSTYSKITKLVLPSAMPLIFTGLRLSLGIGWMVLIAAEMLAQNPGPGKFVWDGFQNGSSQSLAKIMVAVFTIGIIGFLLDRVMFALQSMFTFSENQ